MKIYKIKVWLVALYLFLRIQFSPTLIWKDIQIAWLKTCITWYRAQTSANQWQTAKWEYKMAQLRLRTTK